MAPDLNAIPGNRETDQPAPASSTSNPPSRTPSRPVSGIMGPPPLPLSSPNAGMSANRNRRTSIPAPLGSPTFGGDAAGIGSEGGVPIRHPRPRTAAEMYGEMEKEQEGIVNRLTRELSLLRAQTASATSITSNTSLSSSSTTTSTSHPSSSLPSADPHSFLLTGPTHPTPSRRHRSSSSLSRTSATAALSNLDAATSGSGIAGSIREPPSSSSISNSISNSMILPPPASSSRTPSSSSMQRQTSATSRNAQQQPGSPTMNTSLTSARLAEAQRERAELESVRRENEGLRERVKELERELRRREEGGVGVEGEN
ncbi:MAG: hypothetical protein M1820_007123 [Bogoriella megaspora]|nr:MAG: hypothetical protein M1820_007123 [Bogoriella megaspora]